MALSELRLLKNINEPGLATIEVYEKLGGYRAMRKALLEMEPEEVLHELEGSGLRGRGGLGDRLLGSEHSLSLVVPPGAGAYIGGEEPGLLDSLEGKRGNPRLKPPFPANQGLYQGPTLINNVETLCNAPLIIEHGADWFKSVGTEKSAGSKVVSGSGDVRRPGNYEIELGMRAGGIVYGR